MTTRRLLSVILAAILALSMLVGCGGNEGSDTNGNDTATSTEKGAENNESQDSSTGEKSTIVMSFPVLMITPTEEGTKAVEDKINSILDAKGETFHVDLDPIDGNNYANQVDMNLLGNTQMDIFCPFSGLGQAISGNKLLDLKPYLENELKGTVDIIGERYLTSSTVNDAVYAIPCYKGQILIDYWVVRKDVFDKTGLDPYATYDLDAISAAMAKMHEVEPEIPVVAARRNATGYNTCMVEEYLGGVGNYEYTNVSCGAGVIGKERKIVNYYESEMFEKAVRTAYEWNQNGYVPKDASLSTENPSIDNDQVLSYFITFGYDRDTVEQPKANAVYETYAIPVAEQLFNSSNFIYWGISSNSKNPAEAARFLNMLYTDKEILNLVIFGIEGTDYVITDDTGVVNAINWPEGQTYETVPYTAFLSCGILGNQFIMHAMKGSTEVSDVEFMAKKMDQATYSPLFGFSFKTESVENQISACTNVINQYSGGLYCGELNPDEFLPKFRADLKAAGIDDIIAEVQSQVEAWEKEQAE